MDVSTEAVSPRSTVSAWRYAFGHWYACPNRKRRSSRYRSSEPRVVRDHAERTTPGFGGPPTPVRFRPAGASTAETGHCDPRSTTIQLPLHSPVVGIAGTRR
ncbi:hypothetical protein D8S78_02575 [Natrialba swarupiae]|nr:hypothetical protein [Natrialba swarupiae]